MPSIAKSIASILLCLVPVLCTSCLSVSLPKSAKVEPPPATASTEPLNPKPVVDNGLVDTWELLYQGKDYGNPDLDLFWGLGYSVARILDLRDVSLYVRERDPISKMLFCLHHKLRKAHQEEWPAIRHLVEATQQDNIVLLGPIEPLTEIKSGEKLLSHLYKGEHNMLHFACHAKQQAKLRRDHEPI